MLDQINEFNISTVDKFKVNSLDDITPDFIYIMITRVLSAKACTVIFPTWTCSDRYVLYDDPDTEANIYLFMQINMLNLTITNCFGCQIINHTYEGMFIMNICASRYNMYKDINLLDFSTKCPYNIIVHININSSKERRYSYENICYSRI